MVDLQNRYCTLDLNCVKDWVLDYSDRARHPPVIFPVGMIKDADELERRVMAAPYATPVPPSRIASLARFANTVKVSAVARLPVARRTATLVAFIHSLEASAQDDALNVLAILLRDLFAKAEQADRKVRLRTLKDLDQAASTLAEINDTGVVSHLFCAPSC